MEDLALPVNNIFLEIKGNVFRDAEVLHCIRDTYPQFIADPEKMIDAGLACENYRSKIKNIDLLLAEILG